MELKFTSTDRNIFKRRREAFTCASDIAPLSMPRASLHSLMKYKYSLMFIKKLH